MGVGQHLYFDVAGCRQVPLQVQVVAAKGGHRFPSGRLHRPVYLLVTPNDLHAPAPAPVYRLYGHRPAVLGSKRPYLVRTADLLGRARHNGYADPLGGFPSRDLVTHHLDGLRWWAHEGHPPLGHCPNEVRVLG